jgi:hypothetical protein
MCLTRSPKTKPPLEISGVARIETSPKTPATLPFGPILSLLMKPTLVAAFSIAQRVPNGGVKNNYMISRN